METSVNNRCRAFTSLEQSKVLAEILSLESADCFWDYDNLQKYHRINWFEDGYEKDSQLRLNKNNVCAWSLAALLSVLPKNLNIGRPSLESNYKGYYWIQYYDEFMKPINYKTECFNNPVDACVAMIELLHEQKLL